MNTPPNTIDPSLQAAIDEIKGRREESERLEALEKEVREMPPHAIAKRIFSLETALAEEKKSVERWTQEEIDAAKAKAASPECAFWTQPKADTDTPITNAEVQYFPVEPDGEPAPFVPVWTAVSLEREVNRLRAQAAL